MAITHTTLSAACTATSNDIYVTSGTAFPAVGVSGKSQRVQIDGEVAYTIDGVCQPSTGRILLRSRGADGTEAVAHDVLAQVQTTATGSDWTAVPPVPAYPATFAIVTVGQDGVIPVPTQDTVYILNKATALATTTLAAPAADLNGIQVIFTSATAAAHVITATGLIGDGASGSPEDTATWDAFIGASMHCVVVNGVYNVVSLVGVTIT